MSAIKHIDTKLSALDCPELALVLAILNRAKNDAENGDISAIAFLVCDGPKLEDYITGKDYPDNKRYNTGYQTLEFAKKMWAKIERGELKGNWGEVEKSEFNGITKDNEADYNAFPLFTELEKVDNDF